MFDKRVLPNYVGDVLYNFAAEEFDHLEARPKPFLNGKSDDPWAGSSLCPGVGPRLNRSKSFPWGGAHAGLQPAGNIHP